MDSDILKHSLLNIPAMPVAILNHPFVRHKEQPAEKLPYGNIEVASVFAHIDALIAEHHSIAGK